MVSWFENPLLAVAVLPLLGGLVLAVVPRGRSKAFERGALAVTLLDVLLCLPLWAGLDRTSAEPQWVTVLEWIPRFGVRFSVGADGISLLLVLLTTLLGCIAVGISPASLRERHKEFYVWFLLLQSCMLGVFIAQDAFLFYVFWELMLVPMYCLIGIWGGPRRLYAAFKMFMYTLVGSKLLLLGLLAVYFLQFEATGRWDFSLASFHAMAGVIAEQSGDFQTLLALAWFVAFAVKVPLLPLHTWLPDAHVEAPVAGSVILAGVLLKMGTYGILRFLIPICSAATLTLLPWFLGLAMAGVVYGALVAMIQKDLKALVAYSSISHLGLCAAGLLALNPNGMAGGVLQMVNHGLTTSALFLLVGALHDRRHTRLIAHFGGLARPMPVFATVFLIMVMGSIGLPGLNGFVGEFAILVGVFQVHPWAGVVGVAGIVFGAAYLLWATQRVLFGPVEGANATLEDLTARERVCFLPLLMAAFWIGFYPEPLLALIREPVQKVVNQVVSNPGTRSEK
ncbi:complex I subunit 4 family protein [Mesoterricola silvestris]|uniref:NADH-quinone oxidoreductase subunit M n=1 Tax=Mesoterricola silvestris TaxID=2927979 RepID=A0AA48K969_9BACT|nr:NADH-quinone oxidoreductase subunit M [Mesoterricola silvestris]BDU73699.1 NADH-quinone oxidoreductase subunit M [Mesoterricola silvestris]